MASGASRGSEDGRADGRAAGAVLQESRVPRNRAGVVGGDVDTLAGLLLENDGGNAAVSLQTR